MVRTRFAPSPTGYMHIGNLRTALYEYLIAKVNNGKFILRIEDTDQERYVEGATDIIYKTLELAGMHYDEGPGVGGDYGPYIQSERKNDYIKYAEILIEKGEAYRCFCTKERLDEIKNNSSGILKYDRHCLKLSKDEIKKKLESGEPYVIRQKIKQGKTTFHDEVYGDITVDNSEIEDQILIKSDGLPTYNFANVIDDHLMNITHVIRGNEYLSSTPKYNLLYEAFGWDIPKYIHVPPVMKNSSEKLSKRNGDASFQDLIAKGYLPEAIVNYVALLGWAPPDKEREIYSISELEKIFTVEGLSKSPSVFDMDKLTWMNGEYIKKMPSDKFYEMAEPVLKDTVKTDGIDLKKLSAMVQTRVSTIYDISDMLDFVDEVPSYDISLYTHKKMKTNSEISLKSLEKSFEMLKECDEWTNDVLYLKMTELAKKEGLKNGQILWPIRTALSGKATTPCGASELAELLGKTESLKRIENAVSILKNTK